jgi:Zn-dependent alcohol dehydrogenase
MKAAVCRAFKEPLVIEDVAIEPPAAAEVAVDLAACAICHSDIIFAEGGWGGNLPAVYGHEAAGVVTSVGPGVANLAPGDHVVVTLIRSCGHCGSCLQGEPVTCENEFPRDARSPLKRPNGDVVTQGLRTGAFAESVVVDVSQVVRIPKEIRFDAAALLACGVITGYGAVVNTAGLRPGATAAVIGAGGVGLNAIQGAAISGARTVIALDVVDSKLEAARRFGGTHAVNAGAADATEQVRRITGGRGVDYVFVTVGAKAAFTQAFSLAARSGTIVVVGMPATGVTVPVDPGDIAHHNLRVLGSKMGGAHIQADIPKLVSLYQQGRLKLDELVSGRYALSQINDAMASAKSGQALRNVIMFR